MATPTTSRLDQFKSLFADLARPGSIWISSISGGIATVLVAQKVTTAEGGALVLTVIAGWSTALFAGKVYENQKLAGQSAEVEKERAKANPPPTEALKPAEPAAAETDDGALPEDQRVKL